MEVKVITKQYVDNKITELREFAEKHGYSIKFVRHKKYSEDEFVIFVYKKSVKKSYLVGYDGSWMVSDKFDMCHFDSCVGQAARFIADGKTNCED